MGYDKEEEKNKKEEKERALKERIIAGVKAHNNYRNKYLGALPHWLKELCERSSFRDHALNLRTESALADYGIEQAKQLSKKEGEPWDFTEAKRNEKREGGKGEGKKGTGPIKEQRAKWKEMGFERAEWGHANHDGSKIECPVILKEDLVEPGAGGIAMMGWETFAEKARMLLDLQGGPLAVVLPGTLEEAKKSRGEYWKGDFEGKFHPVEF